MAQLMHQRKTVRGTHQHLGGAGRPKEGAILMGRFQLQIVMTVLDDIHPQTGCAKMVQQGGDQRGLATARAANDAK